MPPPFACLQSFDAFWRAPVEEVADAILWVAFADRVADPAPDILVSDLERRLAGEIPDVEIGWAHNPTAPPMAYIRTVALEALLLLEHRYLAGRHPGVQNSGNDSVRLLRAGAAALQAQQTGAPTVSGQGADR